MLNPKQGEKQQNIKGIKIFPYKHHAYTFFALHFLKKKKNPAAKQRREIDIRRIRRKTVLGDTHIPTKISTEQ